MLGDQGCGTVGYATGYKSDVKGTYLKIIKAVCDRSTANITLKEEKNSPQVWNKTRMSTLITISRGSFGSLQKATREVTLGRRR